ncbi:MAG: type I-E CRISPR-associated protein Cse1/CasA [Acidobacteriota bacterium]|nr:type I-E CRISPR-associated protein Cse1/CasA [Acidobacteriota bacterium]
MHNLLTDPLIQVRPVVGKPMAMSLPEIFETASTDEVATFPALRPHQRHAWHAFLAQLGTIAVQQAGLAELPCAASEWRILLRGVTPDFDDDAPWRLVVDDPAKPAFMQCPAGSAFNQYRRRVATPDDLDLLVTSKNHDVKQAVARASAPEDWVFALIDLQTMAGFLGAGNYPIARMNGGFSARPCLGLAPSAGGFGAHVFHDLRRMLEDRPQLLERLPDYYRPEGGTALLWTVPWDGTTSTDLGDLDPYFIEISRRVRLCIEDRRLVAKTAGSKKSRVAAKAAHGNVGDFWTPVSRGATKALSISGAGFRYDRLNTLLFDGTAYDLPPAMTVSATTKKRWRVVARGMAGGQGKTDGYHERNDIVLTSRVATAFGRKEERDELAAINSALLEEVAEVSRALRLGIAVAASGGKLLADLSKSDRTYARPYARRFDTWVDPRFFGAVERRFVAGSQAATRRERASFAQEMMAAAGAVLAEAVESVPCPAIRRHRARARAFSAFYGSLRGTRSVFGDQPEIFSRREPSHVE